MLLYVPLIKIWGYAICLKAPGWPDFWNENMRQNTMRGSEATERGEGGPSHGLYKNFLNMEY